MHKMQKGASENFGGSTICERVRMAGGNGECAEVGSRGERGVRFRV